MADQASRMGPLAEMAHIGIQRFRTGHAQEHAAQHQKTRIPVREEIAQPIQRVHRGEYRRVLRNAPKSQHPDGQKPQGHDRAEGLAYFCRAQGLNEK